MKQLLLSFLLVALASCSTYLPAPRSSAGLVDYTSFTDNGIFVTESNSVSFDYDPIGSVFVEEVSGWTSKKQEVEVSPKGDDLYLTPITRTLSKKEYHPASLYVAFDNLTSKLKELNANGVINLKVTYSDEVDPKSKLTVEKIVVTGMAIRR